MAMIPRNHDAEVHAAATSLALLIGYLVAWAYITIGMPMYLLVISAAIWTAYTGWRAWR